MNTKLAHDDTGGDGRLIVLLPGAGDVRSENRFLVELLAAAGHRVINVDLPGHGESAAAVSYGVQETAEALAELLEGLDAGPAIVVGNSFAPAAAAWLGAERPELVAGIVLMSAHLETAPWFGRAMLSALLRGPIAAPMWRMAYRGWYKQNPPVDLDTEIAKLTQMYRDPDRRRAARETLIADREGLDERLERLDLPSLVVFGAEDDHFSDPRAEAQAIADKLSGTVLMVEGAGHYPHVEQPELVAEATLRFIDSIN